MKGIETAANRQTEDIKALGSAVAKLAVVGKLSAGVRTAGLLLGRTTSDN